MEVIGIVLLLGVLALPVVGLVMLFIMWGRLRDARRELGLLADRVRNLERRAASAPAASAAPSAATPVRPPVPSQRVPTLESSPPAPAHRPTAAAAPPPLASPAPDRDLPLLPQPPSTPATVVDPPSERASVASSPGAERPSFSASVSGPGLGDRAIAWLLGGNTVVRVGVIVLLFGVGFFLNFVIDQGWLPVEVRLMLAAVGGLALTAVGWRLRARRRDYALVLQGGGVGIVYLTVFAAVNLYGVIAAGPGLALMVVLVALSSALAVLQDARSLAILATLAGFLAPIIVSSEGSHVGLFSYYTVLNVGILGIAWFKSWRLLNLLGFAFTFVVGLAWGAQYYQPAFFVTTEPFLVAFFLFYVAVPVLFATRQATEEARVVDGSLLFGVPLISFGLQAALVGDTEYGLAFSALAAGLFYVALATVLWRRLPDTARLLTEAFLALGVGFATLTIPLAVDGRWTGAAWALEGAGLLWIGVRQHRWLARAAGVTLQVLAGVFFLEAVGLQAGDRLVLNSIYLGALLVSLAGLFSAWYLDRQRTNADGSAQVLVVNLLLAWGLLWWWGAGLREIVEEWRGIDVLHAVLVFAAGTAAALTWLRARLAFRALGVPVILMLPGLALALWVNLLDQSHPLAQWGAVAWGVALGVHYWAQWRLESEWPGAVARYWHAGMLWLVVVLASREVAWLMGELAGDASVWGLVAWTLVPGAAIVVVPRLARQPRWPFATFGDAYVRALIPFVAFAAGWVFLASVAVGDPAPLPYVPIVNPLELAQCLVLAVIVRWWWASPWDIAPGNRWAMSGLLAFVVLNGIVARATHVYAGVDFDPNALWASAPYQTSVSIVWTTAAIAAMLGARSFSQRALWFTGAMLLAAVVAKLFLVDLDGVGTVARMVSFVVVGLLILVVGYLSPLPPRTVEGTQS